MWGRRERSHPAIVLVPDRFAEAECYTRRPHLRGVAAGY
jgi:hypothetical protein